MHAVLDRYTALCGSIIERHGGSVEGFIGDAVVGVFGLSELHEDDALRAVRTAVEMRAAGAELSAELEREWGVGIGMKFGVESGEVFLRAGARRSPFAAGDAFNVASRLEGVAPAGEIFLGENTYPLVRDSVRVTRLEPLELKGRTAKVQAWQLLELEPADGPLAAASPFVGRGRELEELRGAFARARQERSCRAVTVVGPAGMGKSRLVARADRRAARRGDRGRRPLRVLRGGRRLSPARRDRPQPGRRRPARARRRAARRGRPADPARARRDRPGRGRRQAGGDVPRRAAAARARRRRAPAAADRRGHPLGRADPARPARVRRRLLQRHSRS